MIFKTPKQVRPKALGQGKFATGRVDLSTSVPSPASHKCNLGKHMRHEMREHRRGSY